MSASSVRSSSRRSPCTSISPPRADPPVASRFFILEAISESCSSEQSNPVMIVVRFAPTLLALVAEGQLTVACSGCIGCFFGSLFVVGGLIGSGECTAGLRGCSSSQCSWLSLIIVSGRVSVSASPGRAVPMLPGYSGQHLRVGGLFKVELRIILACGVGIGGESLSVAVGGA